MKIGFLGGIPPVLGGGGAEIQMRRTMRELGARGHQVFHCQEVRDSDGMDILHAFTSGPDVWQTLSHWRHHRCPLVVTPIVVVSPGVGERRILRDSRRRRFQTVGMMRRQVLDWADAIIASSQYESSVVKKILGKHKSIALIDNGFDPVELDPVPGVDGHSPYVAMVGTVSPRKGQAEVIHELSDEFDFKVAGGFHGDAASLAEWTATIDSSGAEWLGELRSPGQIRYVLRNAVAMLLFSTAEVQSLAVMESLAERTPVVGSDIPSHRELEARWPGWVRPVGDLREARLALRSVLQAGVPAEPPSPLTWARVAERVEVVYESVLRGDKL